jgi:hypothetical protein
MDIPLSFYQIESYQPRTKTREVELKSHLQEILSIGTIGLTPVTNYGVSTKIAHTGFLNRIIRNEANKLEMEWLFVEWLYGQNLELRIYIGQSRFAFYDIKNCKQPDDAEISRSFFQVIVSILIVNPLSLQAENEFMEMLTYDTVLGVLRSSSFSGFVPNENSISTPMFSKNYLLLSFVATRPTKGD